MSYETLSEFVRATAEEFGVPGVAVGVLADGEEHYACHGVTSIENPLPVDQDTVCRLASITKTYTATTLMRLVAEGRVDLNAPVHTYVPEFTLSDEITVLNLLNHTGGLDWNIIIDTGDGDDALAAFVAKMAEMELIAEPGARASYSQAGFNLVGRIIENVTGQTYEQAVSSLVLEPLGMSHSFYTADDVMTRRFTVGHNAGEDGTLTVARPWRNSRANNPGGGLVSSVADQLRWARFQLGDGAGVLPTDVLRRMQEQTVALRASTLGDGIGIAWFLREIDGVRSIGHGGSASGLFAELLIVPERNFAIVVTSNADAGLAFNQVVVRWALEHYLSLIDRDPEPIAFDEARALEIVGTYEMESMVLEVAADGDRLTLAVGIKPEIRAASEITPPPDYPPAEFGLLPGDGDEYILTDGGLKGQRGFFSRDENGVVTGVDLAGRLFSRV